MTRRNRTLALSAAGAVYLFLHLLSLGRHPFVHSDEAWLASLTRAMTEQGTPAATEDVFVLTPRYPHALKTAWHLVQAPFLAVSWSAYAARLPSLLAAAAVLLFTWKITVRMGLRSPIPFLTVLLLAVNPQFLYLSHLARQETLLIALYAWSMDLKLAGKSGAVTALPVAAGIFVHPNAFIIAVGIAVLYIPDLTGHRSGNRPGFLRRLVPPSGFALVLASAAAMAVGLSFLMDPEFLSHYRRFGDSVGTGDSLLVKLLALPSFVEKMARRQAGTYYLADVRPFYAAALGGYLLFAVGALMRLSSRLRDRIVFPTGSTGLLLSIPAMLLATALVGKYGPPTIGFFMLPGLLLPAAGLGTFRPGRLFRRTNLRKPAVLAVFLVFFGWSSLLSVRETAASFRQTRYRDYLAFVEAGTQPDGRVLANLNTAFAFDYGTLRIWRDLVPLSCGGSLEDFIDREDIRWILLSDELELIYSARPVWNGIYGNPGWYPELMDVIGRRGTLVSVESMPVYAMRIVPFVDRKGWKLRLYRIDQLSVSSLHPDRRLEKGL